MKNLDQNMKDAVRVAVQKAKEENRPLRILFVCLGNICRSPAAQGIMEKAAKEAGLEIEADSAGFYGGHAGELPDLRMRIAARRRDLGLDHRSRQIRPWDLDSFDLIFGMDDSNMADLKDLASTPQQLAKILPMAPFAVHYPEADHIPDPYYGGEQGFDNVLNLLEDAVQTLISEIKRDN